jgi:hypothetical protein
MMIMVLIYIADVLMNIKLMKRIPVVAVIHILHILLIRIQETGHLYGI